MGGDARPFLLNFPGLLRNVPTLEQAASGRGLFTIRPERDGIDRRVPVVMQAQGTIMPSLTLEMLASPAAATGPHPVGPRRRGERGRAGLLIPTDRNGQLWIHFAPHERPLYVPAVACFKDVSSPIACRSCAPVSSPVLLPSNRPGRPPPAGRRSPRAGSRKHPDKFRFVFAKLCDRRRTVRRASSWLWHHLAGADFDSLPLFLVAQRS